MIQIIVTNIFCDIVGATSDIMQLINDELSFVVEGFEIIKKKNPRLRTWDGRKSLFDRRNRCFLTGFLNRVTEALESFGIAYEIIDRRKKPEINIPESIMSLLDGIEEREYQERSAHLLINAGRGTAHLATGSGKSEIAIAIANILELPTLFLTHRAHLLHQTTKRFIKRMPWAKSKIGMIGDGIYEPNEITIATVQTLDVIFRDYDDLFYLRNRLKFDESKIESKLKSLKSKKSKTDTDLQEIKRFERYKRLDARSIMIAEKYGELVEFLESRKVLIIDEAHRSGAKQFHRPAIFCKNAFFRFALTATPFMKGGGYDDMMLMGVAGPTAARVSNKELIDSGILACPYFKFFEIDRPTNLGKLTYRQVYSAGIINNTYRNGIIVKQAEKITAMGKKILIIVAEKEHGRILETLIENNNLRVQYLDGGNGVWDREKALEMFEKDRLDVIVATNVMDEGIDSDVIGAVILAAGMKSAPTLLQRTGRAIRKKEENNFAIIIDFIDKQHPKLLDHSRKRYDLIEQEEGFVILP